MHDERGVIREFGGGFCEVVTRGGGVREDAKVSSKGADKSEVFNAGGGGNFSVREKI